MPLSLRYTFFSISIHILSVLLIALALRFSASPSQIKFSQALPITFEVIEHPIQAVRKSVQISAAESALRENPNSQADPFTQSKDQSEDQQASPSSALGSGSNQAHELNLEDQYKYELRKLIEGKKKYPAAAKSMGYTGTVLIELTLDRAGKVLSSKIVKGSYPSLNDAAQKLISSIDGLKPFPEELERDQWSFQLPIQYLL